MQFKYPPQETLRTPSTPVETEPVEEVVTDIPQGPVRKPMKPREHGLYFENDLTEAQKEELGQIAYSSAMQLLSTKQVTLNGISRIFALNFQQVKAAVKDSNSLNAFYETILKTKNRSFSDLRKALARLSRSQRQQLMEEADLISK